MGMISSISEGRDSGWYAGAKESFETGHEKLMRTFLETKRTWKN